MIGTYPKYEALQALIKDGENKRTQYRQSVNAKLKGIAEETERLRAALKDKTTQFLQAEMSGNSSLAKSTETAIAGLKKQLDEQKELRERYNSIQVYDIFKQDADAFRQAVIESRDERIDSIQKFHQLYEKAIEDIRKAKQWFEEVQYECEFHSRDNELTEIKRVLDLILPREQCDELLSDNCDITEKLKKIFL